MSSSSSSSTFTTTSAAPPMASTDGGDSGGGGGIAQRGANYFFGFLITFVVLLLIFVGCGIGTRRRYLARRQAAMFGNLDPWNASAVLDQKEPVLFEHYIGDSRTEDKWVDTAPLSVTLLRQPKDIQQTDRAIDLEAAGDSQTRSNDRTHSIRALTSLMIPFHERKQSPIPEPEHIEYGSPDALNVAFMIAMPSPRHSHSHHDSSTHDDTHSDTQRLPEMQIGVATIPWRTEIDTGSAS